MSKYNLNRVVEKTEDSVVVEFSVPEDSPYFDGHFPQIKILPGVGQVELVSLFYKEYFNSNMIVTEIKRVKFTDLIMPLFPLVLRIKKNENKVEFKINSPDEEKLYASGTLLIKEQE